MFKPIHAILAMSLVVIASNLLVLIPINDWLTWGAFPYPISYLINEMTNRFYGPKKARRVVYAGFALAVVMSIWLATPKIALASGAAFFSSQLLDIFVFNRWRQAAWWIAPFLASFCASACDAAVFWSLAFWGENVPLLTWAAGDTAVKFGIDLVMLTPYRLAMRNMPLKV